MSYTQFIRGYYNHIKIGLVLCIAILLNVGCSVAPYAINYEVHVNPGFTPEQIDLTLTALKAWENAVAAGTSPGEQSKLSFNITITAECSTLKADNTICIVPSTQAYNVSLGCPGPNIGCSTPHRATGSTRCGISTDALNTMKDGSFNADEFYEVVGHEVGHALGLSHSDPGTLMFAGYNHSSQEPTCKDVAQYKSLRGML